MFIREFGERISDNLSISIFSCGLERIVLNVARSDTFNIEKIGMFTMYMKIGKSNAFGSFGRVTG